jgi:hypothetical protein
MILCLISDFLMMKDCKVIKFGDLDHLAITPKGSQRKGKRACTDVRVWSRRQLAAAYDIPDERSLVLWAIIKGNDFTEHFTLRQLHLPLEIVSSSRDAMLKAVSEHGGSWDPMTAIADEYSRQAVAYSLAFYELEDLTPFMLEKYKTVNQLEELGDLEEGLRLSKASKLAFRDWFQNNLTKTMPSYLKANPANLVILFLEFLLKEKVPVFQDGFISTVHVEAFQEMVTKIKEKEFCSYFPEGKKAYHDQKVANVFQLLTKEVAKIIKQVDNRDQKMFSLKVS